jgi:hypothetical protein
MHDAIASVSKFWMAHAQIIRAPPTCAGGECGIKMRGGPVNGRMGFTCPMAMPGVTFVSLHLLKGLFSLNDVFRPWISAHGATLK